MGKSALTHVLLCHRGTLYVDPSLADKLGRFPDSYLSVANGWNKGLVFINGYNIVRAGCLRTCACELTASMAWPAHHTACPFKPCCPMPVLVHAGQGSATVLLGLTREQRKVVCFGNAAAAHAC